MDATLILFVALGLIALLLAGRAQMADATAVEGISQIADGSVKLLQLPVAATMLLVPGTGVTINATGFAQNAGDDASTVPAGVMEIGQAAADNSSGGAGDIDVRVRTRGLAKFIFSGATQALVGQKVYWVDNQTVALIGTTTNDILAGIVREVPDGSSVVIELGGLGRV